MRFTKEYDKLPFNPNLREKARELRKAGVLSEVILWKQLRNGSFNGLDFDRQKIIGGYIVDFFCASNGVVIEVDGNSHNDKAEYDADRDKYLEGLGLMVIHISDKDVFNRLNEVMSMLRNHEAFQSCTEEKRKHRKP